MNARAGQYGGTYSAAVLDHFEHPRHAGRLPPGPDVIGAAAGSLADGARFALGAKLVHDRLDGLRFQAYGCPHCLAAASWLCERLQAARLEQLDAWRWREAAIAAIVATLLVEALRNALGNYLGNFSTYTVIYGAFSVMPVLLLWLFMAWLIVLLGALVASNLRYWSHDIAPSPVPSPAETFADALAIVRLLAERAPQGHGQGLAARSWGPVFDEDSSRAERAVRLAASLGYVDRMAAVEAEPDPDEDPVWAEYWSLAKPAGQMTLAGLFAGVWGGPIEGVPMPGLELTLDRWIASTPAPADRAAAAPPN